MRYVLSFFCVCCCVFCLFGAVSASGVIGDFALEGEVMEFPDPTQNEAGNGPLYDDAFVNNSGSDGGSLTPMAFLPDTTSGLSGGYYFVCDCALGRGIKFWVPADFARDSLAIDSDGALVNMTNSSVYLMPDNPNLQDYTVYAPRFSLFQYQNSGYNYSDLGIRNITDTNISFMENTPPALSESTTTTIIVAVLCLGFLLLLFGKR